MSSKQECFVYITLPNETEMVTAGRFQHEATASGISRGRFIYGKSYLARPSAVEIDPIDLQLSGKQYETIQLNGVFGALRDASPDYWGRRLIEIHAGKPTLSEMDYLLYSPEDRMGALGFGLNVTPPAPNRLYNQKIQLAQLQQEAEAIMNGEFDHTYSAIQTQIKELLLFEVGTSMGGARPKAVIEDQQNLWVAKFNAPKDPWNNARVEFAMLQLAELCGIQTAQSKLESVADQDVLLLKRFDREPCTRGYLRHRMISALTALKANETATDRANWSYLSLAESVRKISSRPKEDARELYRRMVFNALISNVDDHLRNHAFLAKGAAWQLSPAYDLTPHPHPSLEHRDLALVCGQYGRYANQHNLLSAASQFLISEHEAQSIIHEMAQRIKQRWYATARAAGVTVSDCDKIQSAFLYEGFFYALHEK